MDAIIAQFQADENAKQAAAAAQVEIVASYYTTVGEINVKANAKIDANECEVDAINMATMDVAERLEVAVEEFNGAMSVNLDRAEGAFAALFMLDVEDSNVTDINISGNDSTCFIEGTKSDADAINISGATKVTLNMDADSIVVDEKTTDAKVRIYSTIGEVVVKGDANSIVLPTCGNIGNVAVEGNNVKVYGYGDVESAVITGTGANVAVYGTDVEGENDSTPPAAMIAMNPYKYTESSSSSKPSAPSEPEEDSNLIITLSELTPGGYGYNVENGVVTFEGQYQEIRYTLPEAITVGDYLSMTLNITSATDAVAIKLLDANSNQLAVKYDVEETFTWDFTSLDSELEVARVALMANYTACSVEPTTIVFVPNPDAGEEEEATSVNKVIYTGSIEAGNWSTSLNIEGSNFTDCAFDGTEMLVVTYSSTNTGEWGTQFKFATTNNYTALTEAENLGVAQTATTREVVLTEDYGIIATNGLQIQGFNWTITNVQIIKAEQIYNGSTEAGNWGTSVHMEASAFTDCAFDGTEVLTIIYSSTNTTEWGTQFKFATSANYKEITGVENLGIALLPTSKTVVLTEDYSIIATDGLQIQGFNWTITDVYMRQK